MANEDRSKFAFLPLTVSLETIGGIATPLVLRGSPLPTKRTQTFSTAEDDQSVVTLHLTIGERPLTKGNLTLGKVDLDGIPKAPRGSPEIQVEIAIDQKCLLSVSAVERTSGKSLDAKLEQPEILLNQDRIQEILDTAETERENDHAELRTIEVRNEARSLLSKAEKRVSSTPSKEIEQRIAELGLALQNDDAPAIDSATKSLRNSLPSADVTSDIFGDVFADIFRGPTTTNRTPSQHATQFGIGKTDNQPKTRQSSESSQHNLAKAPGRILELGKIFGGGEFTLDPTLCFVLMPFSTDLQGVFGDHVKPVVEGESLVCIRADEIVGTQQITRDIWEHIHRSRFLIADLTGKNANVFYELGLAHAIGKNVILLVQSMDDVPFDLQPLRCLVYEYTPPGMKNLEQKLRRTIRELMNSDS